LVQKARHVVNPNWVLRPARLVLTPVAGSDLVDLCAIKADPRVFAVMLGGVRTPEQTAVELAKETISWARMALACGRSANAEAPRLSG
jgi:hypothetical protein